MRQRDIYRGLSLWNWIRAIAAGPKATAKRAGRVAILRGAGRINRRLFPPRRRRS